jgi:hypothetical protein
MHDPPPTTDTTDTTRTQTRDEAEDDTTTDEAVTTDVSLPLIAAPPDRTSADTDFLLHLISQTVLPLLLDDESTTTVDTRPRVDGTTLPLETRTEEADPLAETTPTPPPPQATTTDEETGGTNRPPLCARKVSIQCRFVPASESRQEMGRANVMCLSLYRALPPAVYLQRGEEVSS